MKPGILKRDVWAIGMLIGISLPSMFFLVLFIIDLVVFSLLNFHITDQFHYLYLLSLAANLFPIRYYLIKLRYEKTGMGILLITIVAIIGYFFLYYQPERF
jgi:hypothetical protein